MKRSSLLTVVVLSLLSACGPTPTPTPDVAATNTAIAQVKSATLTAQAPTETPTQEPTSTPSNTLTPTNTATSTPTPTVTNTPTATSTPTVTSTPTPADTPTSTSLPTETLTHTPVPFSPIAEIQTLSERRINSVAVDPTNSRVLYVAVQDEGVYKSIDGGASWGLVLDNPSSAHIAMDPTNPQVLYIGVWGGICKTTDGGASWQVLQEGLTANRTIQKVVVALTNPQRLFAISNLWVKSYKSDDGGVSWHPLGTESPPQEGSPFYGFWYIRDLAIDPLNDDVIYVGGRTTERPHVGWRWFFQGGPMKTTDGGKSWSFVGMTDEFTRKSGDALRNPSALAFAIDPMNSQIVYVTLDQGLFKSTDGGASWEYLVDLSEDPWVQRYWDWSLGQNLFVHPLNPQIVFVGNGRVLRSTDGGTNWEEVLSKDFLRRGGDPHEKWHGQEFLYFASDFAFDHNDPQVIYASTWRGLLKSTDVGKTWDWM